MGFFDNYGVAANAFGKNFFGQIEAGRQHRLEREKLLLEQQKAQEQAKLQAAQIQAYQARAGEDEAQASARRRAEQQQTAFQKGYTDLVRPQETYGLMGENIIGGDTQADLDMNAPKMTSRQPTLQEVMNLAGQYATPGQVLTTGASMANTEANTVSREKINEVRTQALVQRTLDQLTAQAERWRERDDARSQAIADKFEAKISEIEKVYGLKRELQDAKKDKEVDRTDKDQIALSRAQQMATRDLEKEYTHDTLTGQWLSNGVPVKQEVIAQKYRQYVQKYMVGGGKSTPTKTKSDPLGIR